MGFGGLSAIVPLETIGVSATPMQDSALAFVPSPLLHPDPVIAAFLLPLKLQAIIITPLQLEPMFIPFVSVIVPILCNLFVKFKCSSITTYKLDVCIVIHSHTVIR